MLPTDTMKNTVYALAAGNPVDEPEAFGLLLAPALSRSQSKAAPGPHRSDRAAVGEDRDRGAATRAGFVRHGAEARTATLQGERDRITVGAGVSDLVILKSSRSGFSGFLRDEFTTLPDVADRILATAHDRDVAAIARPTSTST